MGQNWAWPRPRDLLFKFWDPLISWERLKVQNSNLAGRLIVRDTNPKNEKWVKRGRDLGFVTYIFKFSDPLNISGMAEDTNLTFCMQIDGEGF